MANPYKLSITISADTKEAASNIDRLNEEYGELLKSLGKTPEDIKAFSSLAQDFIATGKAADYVDKETRELLVVYRDLLNVAKSRDILGLVPHSEIEKQIKSVEQAFETLKKSGVLSQQEIARAAIVTQQRIAELKGQTQGVSEAIQALKQHFAGLAASAGGLTLAVKQAMDFESAMAQVAKVTDATDDQISALGAEIKNLSAEIPMSADALARLAAAGGQLGIPVAQIREFTELAAKMAVSFDMSAEEAGQSIAKLMNVFDLTLDRVGAVGDAINALGNNMATTERDIVEVMTRIGGTARQFGLAADQAAALSAAMLALGKSPEVAATGITALLTKLQTANVAGREFQGALNAIGIDAQKLATSIRENPQQALTEFLATLQRIEPMARSESLVKLFGMEYQDDINALIGSIGQYEKALGLVSDRQKTAGAMQSEFQDRLRTTETQIQLLKNAVEAIAINIGTLFLPAVSKIAGGFAEASRVVADFVERFPLIAQLATTIGVVAGSLGALRMAFLAARLAGITLATDVTGVVAAMRLPIGEATAAVGRLHAAFGVLGAFLVGWDIGTWLVDKFELARKAGVFMAESIAKGLEYIQWGWESLKAVFTDDTIEAAMARHEQRLAQMDAIFDQMYAEVEDGAWRAKKSAETASQAVAASAQASAEAAKAAALNAVSQAAAGLDQVSGKAVEVSAAVKAAIEAATAGAIDTTALTALVQQLHAAVQAGQSVDQAVKDLGTSLQRLATEDLAQFVTHAQMAWRFTTEGAAQAQQVLDAGLRAALERLGVDVERVATGISAQNRQLIELFDAVAQSGRASSAEIMAAFEAVAGKVDSIRAIDSLRASLIQLGEQGTLSVDQVAAAMSRLDVQAREIASSLDPVQAAFKELNIQSSAALQQAADKARAAFETIRNSGVASAGDVQRAFRVYADAAMRAAEATGDTFRTQVLQSELEAQEAALGLGDALEQAGERGEAAGQRISSSMRSAAESIQEAAQTASETDFGPKTQFGAPKIEEEHETAIDEEEYADRLRKKRREVSQVYHSAIENWEKMTDQAKEELRQNINAMTQSYGGFNYNARQVVIDRINDAKAAMQELERLRKQATDENMRVIVAKQFDVWRRRWSDLIAESVYRDLAETLSAVGQATAKQQTAEAPKPTATALPEQRAVVQMPSNARMEQLLGDIARNIEIIAKRVSAASISAEDAASMVLRSLAAASSAT